MYPSIDSIKKDVELRPIEVDALTSPIAPIVLCKRKKTSGNKICIEQIAPNLDKIGVMLPCSPLLFLIAKSINKPLIATSGNISGSPILYKDEDALENLFDIADYILTFDREIVAPQDDSVIQFTESEQKIIIRRSRGRAPNYFPNPFSPRLKNIFAAGAELKSAFAFTDENNLYVSQFLGNQENFESQESYQKTQQHIVHLLRSNIKKVLIDKHPNYSVSQAGIELAKKLNIAKPYSVQHHKAHFAAVLFENNLQYQNKKVLGTIWDGTGYGDDKQIWGGEFFVYEKKKIKRVAHFNYFPQLMGDKMSFEPRLSALSLLKNFPQHQSIIQKYFTQQEWVFYEKFIQQKPALQTSSVGRLLDGIACLLGISAVNTYEGEAAMQLETLARNCNNKIKSSYPIKFVNGIIYWEQMIEEIIIYISKNNNMNINFIAWKVFYTLYKSIILVSNQLNIHHLAFSGGVFQNALLVDMIKNFSPKKKHLYFHHQLSANDECIGFGEIACYEVEKLKTKKLNPKPEEKLKLHKLF
jgi:hydrogenase maturation protein HypF